MSSSSGRSTIIPERKLENKEGRVNKENVNHMGKYKHVPHEIIITYVLCTVIETRKN